MCVLLRRLFNPDDKFSEACFRVFLLLLAPHRAARHLHSTHCAFKLLLPLYMKKSRSSSMLPSQAELYFGTGLLFDPVRVGSYLLACFARNRNRQFIEFCLACAPCPEDNRLLHKNLLFGWPSVHQWRDTNLSELWAIKTVPVAFKLREKEFQGRESTHLQSCGNQYKMR